MAQIHDTQQQDERTRSRGPGDARRLRLPRPAIVLPAMAAAVAAAVVAGLAMLRRRRGQGRRRCRHRTGPDHRGSAPRPARALPQLLDQISLAAAEASHPAVKPGQYIYIESKTADTFVKTVDDKTSLASHALHRRQVWNSPDGTKGWLIDPAVNTAPRARP